MIELFFHFASAAATCLDGTTVTTCDTGLPTAAASTGNLQHLLQIVFATFGAIAVLIIVISGLNFINAQGDPSKVGRARSAIIYALVGLAVAISAEAIVSLVLGKF